MTGPATAGAGASDAAAGVLVVDVAIIGGGPAGLSAALNLVRQGRKIVLIDGNRPRNAATFHSHGFITRDGVAPLELRKLARQELDEYPGYTYRQALVQGIERGIEASSTGFTVSVKAGLARETILATTIVIATGVTELMPALPTLRAFYGTSIHSCMECDGFEEQGKPLALIGETDDLANRAIFLSQWSDDIIVFTNGVAEISDSDAAALAERGILIDSRPLADVAGDRSGLTGIVTATGDIVPRSAGFVRPRYLPALDYAAGLGLEVTEEGFLVVDEEGRTSLDGVYAAGDSAVPGPRQLIVAAGQGARVASALGADLIGVPRVSPASPRALK